MTDPARQKEQEFAPSDPAAEAFDPSNDEPLDVDGYEKEYIKIVTHGQSSSHTASDAGSNGDDKKPAFDRTKSYATNTSAVTRTDSHVEEPAQKWYKKLNPLRWGGIPPVPETRKVCREYNAPFLSLVYFQWMAPLMTASLLSPSSS
jgi:ATP-binding cassette, subfamily C (CFTR/MRP), member 1